MSDKPKYNIDDIIRYPHPNGSATGIKYMESRVKHIIFLENPVTIYIDENNNRIPGSTIAYYVSHPFAWHVAEDSIIET